MKKIKFTLFAFIFLLFISNSFAQSHIWTQKADIEGYEREGAVGFSIGTKGYIGTGSFFDFNNGYSLTKDFWEYDPSTNTWTQKADFGGNARRGAVGFSIGTKGYIGTGSMNYYSSSLTKDFWEYDPTTNKWTQKADFGGNARYNAVGFSIGTKGYIGTGNDNDNGGNVYRDFWEYNPSTNTWTQKADFGGNARSGSVGFSIGTKGYIGTGEDDVYGYILYKDFWEYDPSINTWTQKADFGGVFKYDAVGFSIGTKGYIGTGFDSTASFTQDFWEYNPSINTWTQKADFGGTARSSAVGFSIGTKGYIGGGGYQDFWEDTICPSPTITQQPINQNKCLSDSVTFSVSVTQDGSLTYQWKNNDSIINGATNSTYKIDSIILADTGNYSCYIAYSCGENITSNIAKLTVNTPVPVSVSITGNLSGVICSGNTVTFTATPTNGGTTPTYQWKVNGNNVGTNSSTYTSSTLANNDVVTCVLTSNDSCISDNPATSNSITMTVNPSYSTNNPQTICEGSFYIFNGHTYTTTGNHYDTLQTVNGCDSLIITQLTVNSSYSTNNLQTICEGSSYVFNGHTYTTTGNHYDTLQTIKGCDSIIITQLTLNSVPVSINITANPSGAIYSCNTVTFTATPTNGGTTPIYQWKVNGNNVGTNSSTYSSSSLTNNDVVTCVVTSNAGCISGNSATSNSITMIVNAVPVSVSIIANPSGAICSGDIVTFLAIPTNGGTTPTYQWKVNENNVGTNSYTYSSSSLANNDVVTCVVTSNKTCVSNNPATSNVLIILITDSKWTQKADFGGNARYRAVGFSIGTKGYIGTGCDGTGSYTKDFWEYDPSTDIWSQKADFGGNARRWAVGFSIGSKGYIGTGGDGSSVYKDFWEYNPSTNTWTKKADFGGAQRYGAIGFSIGTKGYVGTGNDNNFNLYKDFWEYDPSTNTWTQKADFGGAARLSAVGFSIGTKGYIGTGENYFYGDYKDFWEYDPSTNTWTQKADFGGTARNVAVGFSIGTKGYIGTGDVGAYIYAQDFWEYNPSTDIWAQKADFGGTNRALAVGFSIDMKGYIGTGWYTVASYNQDFWEYSACSPCVPVSVSITANPSGAICSGDIVTFTATPTNGGTTPTYQWKVNGNNVGTNSSTYTSSTLANNDVVTCVLTSNATYISGNPATSNSIIMIVNPIYSTNNPQTICEGSSYVFNGHTYTTAGNHYDTLQTVNNCDSIIVTQLTVNPLPLTAGTISGTATVCQGQDSVTYTVPTITNANSYVWTLPTGANGISTTDSITVNYGTSAISGNITVKGTNSCGDGTVSTLPIIVNSLPANAGTISGTATVCQGQDSVTYTVPTIANATSYVWTLPTGATGTSTNDSITVNYNTSAVSGNITVKGRNSCGDGCLSTLPIVVNAKPSTPSIILKVDTLHSDAINGNQWYNQNGLINDAINQDYHVTANDNYYVIVTINSCSSDKSNVINIITTGIEVTENNKTIRVYPNPVTNELIIEIDGNNKKLNFEILNTIGQVVFKGNLIDKTTIQTNNFLSGVYLIKFENGKTFEFKKIIKE